MGERQNGLLRKLDYHLGIPLTYGASLFRKLEMAVSPKKKTASLNIGIICLGAIGDLLLLSGLVAGLRSKFPAASITIISSSANAQALGLLPGAPFVKAFPVTNPVRIISFLRSQKFDYLFDSTQWARIGNLLSNLSGSRIIAGFNSQGQHRSAGYDHKVEHLGSKHESENFLNLGRAVWPDLQGRPKLCAFARIIPELLSADDKIIFCHMWSGSSKARQLKEWPADNWARLIGELTARGFKIGLTGSGNEAERVASFTKKYFPGKEKPLNLAGRFSLGELAGLFHTAQAVISVDTGIMHLASILDVPLVGLMGPASPDRWGPLGKHSLAVTPKKGSRNYLNLGMEVPAQVEPCMPYLEVSDVLSALKKLNVIN